MIYACLVPRAGPDRFVALTCAVPPDTVEFGGTVFHRTAQRTHGGWFVYKEHVDG